MSNSEEIERALAHVFTSIPDPRLGLPDSVFEFILKVTSVINVDLLIQDPSRGTLAVWRDDRFGTGWHIPGGIIRFREPLARRISEVARLELGASVEADLFLCDMQEFFSARGHFISLLYRCRLTSEFSDPSILHLGGAPRPGSIGWFADQPSQIYPGHEVYLRYFSTVPRA